jgi:hypothetical protein
MTTMSAIEGKREVAPAAALEAVREAGDVLQAAIMQAKSVLEMIGTLDEANDDTDEMEEARERAAAEPFLDTTQTATDVVPTLVAGIEPFPTAGPRALNPELNSRFNRVLTRVFADDARPHSITEPEPSALVFAPASSGNVQLNFANGGFSSHYTPTQPKDEAPAVEGEDETASVALPS